MSGPYVTPSDSPEFALDPSGNAWWLGGAPLPAGWVQAWLAENMTLGTLSVHPDTWELWNATQPADEAGGITDESLDWPWLRFLDGIGQILGRITDLSRDDPVSGDPGWSIILDPARCPTYALPWLAQTVGVRFDATQLTDATQRAAIQAEQAWNRGTPAAMQAAASKYLAPGQELQIYERDTSPYHLTVVVTLGQLASGTYDQLAATYSTYTAYADAASTYDTPAYPEAQILAALQSQKPGALVMAFSAIAGITYDTLDGRYATYNALDEAFATYNALTATT